MRTLLWIILPIILISGCGRVDLSNENKRSGYALGRHMAGDYFKHNRDYDWNLIRSGMNDAMSEKSKEPAQPDSATYMKGWNIEKRISICNPESDIDAFIYAVKESLKGKKNRLNNDQMNAITEKCQKKWAEYQKTFYEDRVNEAGKEKKLLITDSGLIYEVIEAGNGKRPGSKDRVRVQYSGILPSGEAIETTHVRDKTHTIPMDRVIKGWQEGLLLMREGATYRFYIPPSLAYGKKGRGTIPPNTTLIYEIKLVKVLK